MVKGIYVKSSLVLIIGLLLLMVPLIFGISCYGAPEPAPAPAPAPAGTEMVIENFAFHPNTITVPVGTTITWTNKDSPRHTVTSREPLFDSGNLANGETFSFTFDQPGTYEYYCTIHPRMVATIIVE